MAKSKGRRLAEWLRNLDSDSKASSSTLADDSVTAAKIADDAVTNAAIADGAVHTANIADTGVTFPKLHTALVVTESDAIGSNDNDTTIATSAAIKDYVDTQVAGKDALSELSGSTDDITEGSTNFYFTNARARSALSVTTNSAGTAALSYTSGTGVLSYTPPDLSSYLTTSSAITVGNITTTGYLRGPSTFTIDPATHGDNTGTLVIAGNLQVDGTTTTINSTTMTVDDLNITLASGAANAAAANGAGITVDGASATLTYNGTNDDWNFNKDLNVSGNLTSTGIDDNASSTAITIDSSDRVGIGITSMNANLEVAGTGTTSEDVIHWSNSSGVTKGMLQLSSTGGGQLQLRDAGNTVDVQISSTTDSYFNGGNVGIGTTSPSRLLTLSDSGSAILSLVSTTDNTCQVLFGDSVSDSIGRVSYDHSDNSMSLFTSQAERMHIDSSGNVGIGTSSPGYLLELATSTTGDGIKVFSSGATPPSIDIGSTRGASSDVVLGEINGLWDGNEVASIRFESGGDTTNKDDGVISFYTSSASSSPAERMRIQNNGRVGIGTTPSARLHVLDTTSQWGIVGSTSGSTYVQFRSNTSTARGYIGNGSGLITGASVSDFIFRSQGAIAFASNGATEQMRIETTGNVEITNGDLDMSGGYIEKQNSELNGYIVGGYNSIGSTANSKTNPIYAIGSAYTPASETSVGGFYGIGMTRARSSGGSSYLADLDWTLNTGWGLYVAAGSGPTIFLDATNGDVNWTGNLAHNGTVVMDSSRDLKNIPLAQIGSITQLNTYGTLQVNQSANNDESGFGILDSTAARSMRLWCDATSSYINSGNGGSGNLILNEAITVSDVGVVTGIRDITPDADGTYNLGTSGTRWANVYADGITTRQSTFTISDTTPNTSLNGVSIDFDLSGADALTADRTKRGLFIDVDSSATGGTTTDEHRIHGLSVDVRATGDSDLLYGTYSYAESQHSDGQITQVTGVLGYAIGDDTGTGHTANVYGVQALAYGYGSGSGGTTSFTALYGKTLISTANDKDSNVLTGTYSEIEIDNPGQAQTVSTAYVFRGEYDDDSAGNVTVTNGYLFYGNYAGTKPTNAYGIYIADGVQSYFGGGNVTGIADLTTTGQLNPQTIYVKSNTYTTTSDIALTSNGVIKSGSGLWIMSGSNNDIHFGSASNDAPTTGWQSVTEIAAMEDDGDLRLFNIGSLTEPAADNLLLNGYGLMGNRSSAVYVTNAGTGGVQINADGGHGTTYRVALFDQGGITFDDPLSVTGNITSTGNVSSGSTGDVIAYGGATHLSANGIYFENNKHCITKNDGYGNFNIRVGHTHSNAEAATEAGYIFQDEWSQSSGWRQFNISSASLSVGNTPTWRTQIYYDSDYSSLRYQGSEKGYTYASGFRVTGNLLATSDVYAYYSDERLKDKTGKIENALDKVDAIETFYYTHNDKAIELGYEGKDQQVGVSAQSVEAVMPEVVHLAPIDNDGEGNSISGEDYKTVQYEKLVPLLIEAIKELKAEIEELKK